jgi:putative tryptophan/tyrosine transport system substrate-binding protein
MRRRAVLKWGTVVLAAPALVLAQAQKQFRVGILWATDEAAVKAPGGAFLAGLRDFGYIPGKNLAVDVRHARGDFSRLPALAAELVALKPDVLVAIEAVAVVLRSQTATIPIVLIAGPDPVAAGLVKSVARPGTNVTGNAFRQDELVAKQVEILMEVVPGMSRVALLNYDPPADERAINLAPRRYEEFAKKAAAAKGLALTLVAARDPAGLNQAFAVLEQARPHGVVLASSGALYQFRQQIADAARRLRLPSISALPPGWLQAGGMLDYGPDFLKHYRYAARFVDRILKGTTPAVIPIEYPTTFELSVNLKTAREIGITIPRSIVARADRVIE